MPSVNFNLLYWGPPLKYIIQLLLILPFIMNITLDRISAIRRDKYVRNSVNKGNVYFSPITCNINEGELLLISSKNWLKSYTLINAISHSPNPYFATTGRILYNDSPMSIELIDEMIALVETINDNCVNLSIEEVLQFYSKTSNIKSSVDIVDLMSSLNLYTIKGRRFGSLPIYEKQLTLLAKYIIMHKKIIVFTDFLVLKKGEVETINFVSTIKRTIVKHGVILVFSTKSSSSTIAMACDKFIGIDEQGNTFHCTKQNIHSIINGRQSVEQFIGNYSQIMAGNIDDNTQILTELGARDSSGDLNQLKHEINLRKVRRTTFYPKSLFYTSKKFIRLVFCHNKFFLFISSLLYFALGYDTRSTKNAIWDKNNIQAIFSQDELGVKKNIPLLYNCIQTIIDHQKDNFNWCNMIHHINFVITCIISVHCYLDVIDGCINLFTLYLTNLLIYMLVAFIPHSIILTMHYIQGDNSMGLCDFILLAFSSILIFIQCQFILCMFLVDNTGFISSIFLILNQLSSTTIGSCLNTLHTSKYQPLGYISWIYFLIPITHIEKILMINNLQFVIKNLEERRTFKNPVFEEYRFEDFRAYDFLYNLKLNEKKSYYMLAISTVLIISISLIVVVFRKLVTKRVY